MGTEVENNYEELSEAFLGAFRTYDDLERMLKFRLNTKLSKIAPDTKPLSQVIFDLIDHFEAQGKLLELIRKAHHYNPDNPKLKKIYKTYFPFELPKNSILDEDKLNKLIWIIQNTDFNNINFLRNICGQTIQRFTDSIQEMAKCNDIFSLLETLLRSYPKQKEDDIPAIFEFAQRLYDCDQQNIKDSSKYEVKEWLIEATEATRFSFPIKYKQAISQPLDNQQFSQYIAIVVQEKTTDEEFYLSVTKYDINNIEDTKYNYTSNSFFYGNKTIAKEVANLINNEFYGAKSLIELFMTYEQIIHNGYIDLEKIEEDFGDLVPIGYQYCFVIRCKNRYLDTDILNSLNRRNRTNFKNKLLDRWKLVIDILGENNDENIIVNKSDYLNSINTCNWRELLLAWEEKKKISVNITCCLQEDENSEKFFQYLLRGGIPICLWNRGSNLISNEVEKEFKQIMTINARGTLNDIHKAVHSLRKHAHVKGNQANKYIGYHLGFLLDHPDRIPSCINEMY